MSKLISITLVRGLINISVLSQYDNRQRVHLHQPASTVRCSIVSNWSPQKYPSQYQRGRQGAITLIKTNALLLYQTTCHLTTSVTDNNNGLAR